METISEFNLGEFINIGITDTNIVTFVNVTHMNKILYSTSHELLLSADHEPVFKDLYANSEQEKIKRMELGNWDLFAEESSNALDKYKLNNLHQKSNTSNIVFPKWRTVAQNVISIIENTK